MSLNFLILFLQKESVELVFTKSIRNSLKSACKSKLRYICTCKQYRDSLCSVFFVTCTSHIRPSQSVLYRNSVEWLDKKNQGGIILLQDFLSIFSTLLFKSRVYTDKISLSIYNLYHNRVK
jgi:hypothetical protein